MSILLIKLLHATNLDDWWQLFMLLSYSSFCFGWLSLASDYLGVLTAEKEWVWDSLASTTATIFDMGLVWALWGRPKSFAEVVFGCACSIPWVGVGPARSNGFSHIAWPRVGLAPLGWAKELCLGRARCVESELCYLSHFQCLSMWIPAWSANRFRKCVALTMGF